MAKFRTRARTLDLLGRQQIAGIPTAISELFKNAHDAYADHVEVDYFRSDRLFVLRDDGVGMTVEEFSDRWLTIGTEGKLTAEGVTLYHPSGNKPPRPMLGEKGIGRLAIATIAPQLLVLTRARRNGILSNLTVAFINWSVFESAGVNIEDIRIPIRTFPGGELPTRRDVNEMIDDFLNSNRGVSAIADNQFRTRIDHELDGFIVDPQEIDGYLGSPSLTGLGSGTHFLLMPASALLAEDIDGDPTVDKASPLMKALVGFANTLSIDRTMPLIQTAFRDHKTDEIADDIIGEREFFTRDEFSNADHQVTGTFDAYGQFTGHISIYGTTIVDHIIPWRNSAGTPTSCGPFRVRFAAIEGESKHSTLPNAEHAIMAEKTNQLGGLYIYRDGIRILPYGDTDYDWLDIEYRRTKSAYYYYFSHRKMFGAVELTSEHNSRLREKAGREGFQENKAYREFRRILRNLFVQMAADFFRKDGVHSERFVERKDELEKDELTRRRREKLVSVKRRQLSDRLQAFFECVASNEPREQALRLSQVVEKELRSAISVADRERAAVEVIRVEQFAIAELARLESRYRIRRPRIALSKALQQEWREYTVAFEEIRTDVFRETRELIEGIVSDEAARARLHVDRRLRVESALNDLAREAQLTTKTRGSDARTEADKIAEEVRSVAGSCLKELESELRVVISDLQRVDVEVMDDDDLIHMRDDLESRIRNASESRGERLESIKAQLEAVDLSGDTSAIDQLVAVEQRNVALEEQTAADLQLAQLGMAVEVINHEFSATVRSLRNNLRRLKAWSDVNKELEMLYQNIRASFDHLDGYLTLFTPLHRRLYRKEVSIQGSDIFDFLQDLFRVRLERHHVNLVATEAFAKTRIVGFPSSFYPVFVNLVDNSIFWLAEQNKSLERWIRLDAERGVFQILDSGPGVNRRDAQSIFEYGFSRKPGGSGMGLAISRDALRRVGYDLLLGDRQPANGTMFLIGPNDQQAEA